MAKELNALIGILIAARRNHGKRLHLDKMWASNELFFTAAMLRDRYKSVVGFIRLDIQTR
jgi:hypothetical protein